MFRWRKNGFASINEKTPPGVTKKTKVARLYEDFSVLSKMYMRSEAQSKDRENSFSGFLTELDLVKCYNKGKEEFFIIENSEKTEIPDEIILYAILDNENFDLSLSLNTIEKNNNSVGTVFAINKP